jgi:hypothetical protein
MSSRQKRIEAEATALWRELYKDAPPAHGAGAGDILDLMLRRLPDVSYERLNSPYLRRNTMAWPKRR